ncbi:Aminoalkylphosphonate N-acetyltransferase [bacterium HR08]|uniref:GCN5-related N-acetyltransferase n=1 Tax=uncultured Acidobacteriota bacterium TaxID=171953 RepID=H5SFE5_9BACT|nr:GCN5-related N-acetyltransferase [uncultured Acidobacteriota bacterium]GBC78656.1 Aminoalkylphosphonate N-acetyltransferase [bacterium HR08]
MTLRDYRPEDFDRLCEIDRLCFPPGIAYTAEEMRLYIADRRTFTIVVEEPEHRIVGFLIARLEPGRRGARVGHLVTIDVHPDQQGRGIGSRLLREAERRLRQAGARAIFLETAVDNHGAIRFYEKHGYRVLKRIRGYYLGEMDAFRMGKALEPTRSTGTACRAPS